MFIMGFFSKKRALIKEIDNLKEIIKQKDKIINSQPDLKQKKKSEYNRTAYLKLKNKENQNKDNNLKQNSSKELEKPLETNLSYVPDGQVMSEKQKQFLQG
ncbi:unnamed protein product [marine sediment metagenome]|uniref:Uncharacterized protein n=1 Tax=marine sediment metagenome TaxID=412755 RepID=X1LNY2_9ZZZZ